MQKWILQVIAGPAAAVSKGVADALRRKETVVGSIENEAVAANTWLARVTIAFSTAVLPSLITFFSHAR
jgi:hypothetical protein